MFTLNFRNLDAATMVHAVLVDDQVVNLSAAGARSSTEETFFLRASCQTEERGAVVWPGHGTEEASAGLQLG